MDATDLKRRTKQFALNVLRIIDELPNTRAGRVVSGQLGRSGTSVGANYRAACRARSRKEFIAKVGVVEEESDESVYWLELIGESKMLPDARVRPLWKEANEICAIMVASIRSARANSTKATASPIRNPQSAIRNRDL